VYGRETKVKYKPWFCGKHPQGPKGIHARIFDKKLDEYIKVRTTGQSKKKNRTNTRLSGFGPHAGEYGTHNNSPDNALRGVIERVFLTSCLCEGKGCYKCCPTGLTAEEVLQDYETTRELISMVEDQAQRQDLYDKLNASCTSRMVYLRSARGVSEREAVTAQLLQEWKKRGTKPMCKPPAPKKFELNKVTAFMDEVVTRCGLIAPLTFQEFLDQVPPPKRALYASAMANIIKRGISEKDAMIKFFIKAEKTNFTEKPDPAPRVISPRTPEYNLMLGCFIRACEHKIYQAIDLIWDPTGHVKTVMKGYNSVNMASRIVDSVDDVKSRSVDGNFHAVSMDASRWDQHVSVEALKKEHYVYNSLFKDPQLAWCLRQQLTTTGTGWFVDPQTKEEVKIKYFRSGGRCSGDMNTGLGNVLLACGLMHVATREFDSPNLINNGDDCVVLFTTQGFAKFKTAQDAFVQQWTDWGFTMKFESNPMSTCCIEQIEFCQMQPICVGGKWRMIRNLQSLSKDAFIIGKDKRVVEMWMHQVGAGGSKYAAGVPCHMAFYDAMPRSKVTHKYKYNNQYFRKKLDWLSEGVEESRDVEDSTRHSYWRAFGVLPIDQKLFEVHMGSLDRGEEYDPPPDHLDDAERVAHLNWLKTKWVYEWRAQDHLPPNLN
jgi:hypothetical protein